MTLKALIKWFKLAFPIPSGCICPSCATFGWVRKNRIRKAHKNKKEKHNA